MKKCLKFFSFVYFFTCFFMLFGNTAFAYIDPSAVSYIIQAVAGVLIAVGAACTVYRHKIMKFIRKKQKKRHMREKEKENNESHN